MPLVRCLLGLLAVLTFHLGWAGAGAGPLEVQFRTVAVPQNSVPAIAQDRAGFLWVATSKGVMRYDGYRLRPIEMAGDTPAQRGLGWVRAMAPAADGRMWIGTEFRGLVAYDPALDRVVSHANGAAPAPIRALAEDRDGVVWIGTLGGGLQRYDPRHGQVEPQALTWHGEPESRVLAVCAARDGSVWAGHWRGLAQRVQGTWRDVELPGLGDLPRGATVQALVEDGTGRVWLGTQDGRLGVVERGRVRWVQALRQPVQALAQAVDGRLWVGAKNGLFWVDVDSGAVEAELHNDARRLTGLAGNDISGLLRDRSGAMWVSGYGLGVQRHLSHPALAVRGPDVDAGGPLAEADVRAVLVLRSGEVLAATQSGTVVRLDGRPGRDLASLGLWPRERHSVVESLAEAADGSLWMAAAGRLEHRAADGRLLRDWPLDGGRAQQLMLRADGGVWLGMQEGLYRLAGPAADALVRVQPPQGPPLQGGVYVLRQAPDGRLWVGGQKGLLREREPGDGLLGPVPQAPGEGLGSPAVMALLWARDGQLWLDTPVSGLHRLKGWDAQGRARFERISERHGLEGVFGGHLHEDAQGRIWSQLNVYDPATDRIDGFGPAEGANFGSFWFFASAELPGGGLLFGGSRGLLRVLPEVWQAPDASPPLVISGLRVNGQPAAPPRYAGDVLPLASGKRTLSVEFAALDFADPARLRYQYRLQGLDDDWTRVDATGRNPSFGPLQPGRYTLQVRATAHPEHWDGAMLEVPIELAPAWWETGLAHVAALLAGLAAVWAWTGWRTRALRRHEAELQALVAERTAELRELSLTDALTGLRNRRYLELRLDDDLALCLRRFEAPGDPGPDADLLLMLLDLDHFKCVNDEHGHAAGDAVLVQLAARLRGVFRETDSLVRWGGEEVLVLARETERRDAAELAARVCAAVREQPFDIGTGEAVHVTVSIGFCAFPLDPKQPRLWDWRACLALADSALYAAKARRRDGFVGAVQSDGLTPDGMPSSLASWQRETRLVAAWSEPRPAAQRTEGESTTPA
ncbi:ligand-binding sensor domain-containing diguanylate cyclase [Pelomonas cellulosilytica]|uniref:diguanylate cyclase n=1 Tax=Pelomonas cellulosilytica TaxID=2906762 RepID=A0ABS8Y1K2_9BURK|nr:ligand-binding sensor domain-containing diguanylate cyclase [Pelomonas sp. P8]MCE4555660.1 diguanylate cyclase [Pelomonas sp. P8]